MDIQFIQQKYRDDIFKLMQLCGIEMAQAYQLYMNACNNFDSAVNMHFNGTSGQSQNFAPNLGGGSGSNKYQNLGANYGQNYGYQNYDNNDELDDFDRLYQKYKIYKQGAIKFQSRYQLRKQSGVLSNLTKLWKSTPEYNYKKILQNYLGKPCTIQFAAGSLSNTLASSDKFPVIVYNLDFNPALKQKLLEIFKNPSFTEVVNVQYKNFGIDKSYQIEKTLLKFVDPKKYNNSLIILRVNAVEEIQIIETVSLINLTFKQILQKMKLAKNSCISKDLDDGHLQRRYNQELMGNFDYQKPMSIAERRKVAQDRQIRKKQQEQFLASMKNQSLKQTKNSQSNQGTGYNTNTGANKNTNVYQNTKVEQKKQAPKRNIPQQRKQIRDRLKTYTSGMNIKLRLPNGQAVILTVDPSQKGKYLQDYVLSLDQDIGFEKDEDRKFDVIRPYDKLNVTQRLNQSLKDIFEGSDSENLAVRQKD